MSQGGDRYSHISENAEWGCRVEAVWNIPREQSVLIPHSAQNECGFRVDSARNECGMYSQL